MSYALPTSHGFSDTSPSSRATSTNGLQQTEEQSLFSREEVQHFAEEDVVAGRSIGKILAALFVYTLIAMSIATWWTFRTVGH